VLGKPVEEFAAPFNDPVSLGVAETWFARKDGKQAAKTAEGFLFPATYEFNPSTTPADALKAMVKKFNDVATEMKFIETVAQNKEGFSAYEALVAASLAEGEFQKPEDMAKGTRAMYYRAYSKKFPCSCLGVDATFNYYFKMQGKAAKESKDLTVTEMQDKSNPYNTYTNPGLPPGPIGNPGKNAMTAAMSPATGTWAYWVTVDKNGLTLFSQTYAQFCANVRTAVKNEVLTQNC
jgi:UPF0755 protein